MRELVREVVLGYLFWSLFQGLGPMIWFYPLNELEISGYEVFCLLWLSPVVTGIGWVFTAVQNRTVLAVLRLVMLLCIGSFQAPTTLHRLIILAVGNGCAMLVLTATLWSKSSRQRCITGWGLILGYFAVTVSRIWFTSFIPTWWSEQTNTIVLALGTVATVDKILSGDDCVPSKDANDGPMLGSCAWVPTSLGFGSLLFLTHWIFGEVSVVARWTVAGLPNHGPMPYPWGAVILISLASGILLSAYKQWVSSFWWSLLGFFSLAGLYWLPAWQGFACGSCLAVYTLSIWPIMIDRLTSCPPTRTVVTMMLVYLVEIFFSVWTVAYNFVPGGIYTREHTDYLIVAILLSIGLSLATGRSSPSRTSYIKMDGHAMPNRKTFTVLFLLLLVGLGGFGFRYRKQKHEDTLPKNARHFTAAIWTYHFGYDNKGWPSLERSATMLRETGADVITLLESDASKPFLGNNDLGMWLGEKLNMYVDFGVSTKDHTWGNLLLSKYPIVKSKHHLLPSPHGELAPGITATVNISGSLVDFVVTHMGNDRDVLDRELQAKLLSEELRKSSHSAVFLGYVTSSPGSRDYKQLINHGRMKDIDDTDRERWCEYIMYKNLIRLGYARISHAGLSDTEVQAARFQIPSEISNYKDNDKYVTNANEIPQEDRFNERFGKFRHGHNSLPDHLFHMSTPKYFLPKTGR